MDSSQEGASFSISRKGYAREEVDEYVAAKERLLVDANHDIRQLQTRLTELEPAGSRVVQLEDDLARAQRKASELEEKLEDVRTEAISGTDDGELQSARQRIRDLEQELLGAPDSGALVQAQQRIQDLEQQVEMANDDDGLALAQRRIHELETQLASMSDDDRLGQAQQRIEELEEQLASGVVTEDSVRIMLVEATKTRDKMIAEATESADRSRTDAEEEAGRIVEQAVAKAQDIVGRAKTEAEAEREASASAAARMIGEANDRVQALRDESRQVLEERESQLRLTTENHEADHAELVIQLAHMRDAYSAFEERLRFVAEATVEEIATDQRGFEEFDLPEPGATIDAEVQARQAIAGMIAEIEEHGDDAEPELTPVSVEDAEPAAEPLAEAHADADMAWADEESDARHDSDETEARGAEPVSDHSEPAAEHDAQVSEELEVPAAAATDDLHDPHAAEIDAEELTEYEPGSEDVFEPETANGEPHDDDQTDEPSQPEVADEADEDEPVDYFADPDAEEEEPADGESFYSKRGSKLPRLGDAAAKEALGGLNSLRSSFKD